MVQIYEKSVGEAWLKLVESIFRLGEHVDDEIDELRNVQVGFSTAFDSDPLLQSPKQQEHIEQMRKVFFSRENNIFGHSYYEKGFGPYGNHGHRDIVDLLQKEPSSKRAMLAFVGDSTGKVPCINNIHFLFRNGTLQVSYFARGQDIYRKFYADAICIYDIAAVVADELSCQLGTIHGTISSAHLYKKDYLEIKQLLENEEKTI